MRIKVPPNPTPEQLEVDYAAGLLRKEQLEDGAFKGLTEPA